ncbi:caspase domain-containing protein [Kribbella sp. VKM Ac-2571]|uniref:caspase, EACC1-associated type n=1 Tax=Kribbella sp. VKM Ac-2571 TaxID=2512222 RepID=UPI00105F2928|nr:caspase family protein [Kribbella sp. VKM Ac-2571]TDO54075.1 caspase domain-containing protein [Kribbella sp. VKM Ac-2571]
MSGSRVALVVANDEYDDPGLRRLVAPAQDAAALAEVLADPAVGGFEVQVLRNASAQAIRVAVEDFFADRVPEDLLLLHFSCHGLKNAAGELYLAVADTRPSRLASTAVAADFVNRQMADSRAQRIALFLDCCYGGAFPRGMVVRAAGEAQVQDAFARQADVGGGRGRVVITASSAMEYAFEGGQLTTGAAPAPSVFTGAVVDGLTTGEADRDGDGWVGLSELVGFVTDRVHRVTPNQNPQMWTFGSQGELLIARSRIRRITAAPLASELVEAMDSPLPAARFGVVDYLRERLSDADLGQAYAAWQALHRMTLDDSRKVSEAAATAIASAVPNVTPPELTLDGTGAAEVRLDGPPLALTAVASAADSWLTVEQHGSLIRVQAGESGPGAGTTTALLLTGPTVDLSIPVRVAKDTAPDQQPVPTPHPEPPQPEPPHVEQMQPAQKTAVAAAMQPWWLVAVLVLAAAFLVLVNWPGSADSRKLWYDPDPTGWYIYRTWADPAILAASVAVLASLLLRFAGAPALGVIVGCVVSLLEDGLVTLGGGISADETSAWAVTVAVSFALVVVLVLTQRPRPWPLRPVKPLPAALVVAGGLLLVIGLSIQDTSSHSLLTVTPLFLLEPLVTVALAWSTLAAVDAVRRAWLTAATLTLAVLGAIAAIPTWTQGHSVPVFVVYLVGNVLLAAGVLIPAPRLRSRP